MLLLCLIFHSGYSLLPTAISAGHVVLLGFKAVSTLGCLVSSSDEDHCRYQREEEDSSGDHKGEMQAREERLLIPHQCSQDRDSYDTAHLPAHVQHARCYP